MAKDDAVTADDVAAELERTPFVPLRLHLKDGRRFDISHRNAAHVLSYGVLVLLGLKEGSPKADGYDRFPFDAIARIEQRSPKRGSPPRRKAS